VYKHQYAHIISIVVNCSNLINDVSRFVHLVASHRQGLLLEGVGADDVEQKEDLFIFQVGALYDQIVAFSDDGNEVE
jgi:hypothetical protein